MRFDILTIFPDAVLGYINSGVLGRAKNLKNLISVDVHDIRENTNNPHKKVDDTPFGGGAGMVIQIEPIYQTLKKIINKHPNTNKHIIFFKAGSKIFNHDKAVFYANNYDHLIFICGRYEGIDYRVEQYLAHESISIGKFVLTGGELPALIVIDAVSRHIPNVLGNTLSAKEESWSEGIQNEHPQYSKPRVFTPDNPNLVQPESPTAWPVPEVLISGDHKAIQDWRKNNST